jgi:hypothetical protein
MAAEVQAADTSRSQLTRADILTVLGWVQRQQPLGLALMYARYTDEPAFLGPVKTAMHQEAARLARGIRMERNRRTGVAVRQLADMALAEYLRTPSTPGARCRCGGSGMVRDMQLSRAHSKPVDKVCPRCGGTGLKPITAATRWRGISKIVELDYKAYLRHWEPMHKNMVAWCYQHEAEAERCYYGVRG